MKFKKSLPLSALILFISFLIFTVFVHFNLFKSLDLNATIFLQRLLPRELDISFSLFSLVGSMEIVLLIMLILWYLNKKMNYFYVLLFFGLFHVFEFMGKFFVNHPGPASEFFRYNIPFLFPSSGVTTGSSYPSGHMGRTIFTSVIIVYLIFKNQKLNKNYKYIFVFCILIFDLLMLVSRIYLGEHWFSDVMGGGILGLMFGLITVSLAF